MIKQKYAVQGEPASKLRKGQGKEKMKKFIYLMTTIALVAGMALLSGCGSSKEATDYAYIEDKGTLTVGLDDTFAPMGFRDKDDNLVGVDIDLAKAVGKKLGIKVEFQPIDWDAKEAELKSKNIDCVWNGMSATKDRQKSMTLSNKYFNNKILVMSLDKGINIKSSADLKNYKVGTQADSAALESVKADKNYDSFADNVSEYPTYDEAILDMKAGRIDVIVIDEVYALYNNKNKTKLYQSDFDFGSDKYAVGFRKGDKELAVKVNDAIQECIDDGTADKICEKWFGKDSSLIINEGYDN